MIRSMTEDPTPDDDSGGESSDPSLEPDDPAPEAPGDPGSADTPDPDVTDAGDLSGDPGDGPGDPAADEGSGTDGVTIQVEREGGSRTDPDPRRESGDDDPEVGPGDRREAATTEPEERTDQRRGTDRGPEETDRRRGADHEHEETGRGRGADRGQGETDRRRGDPDGEPSAEERLEREILDPEERIGPTEEYCRHCGAVFSPTEDSCPDCGSPHPRTKDPPASTRKVPTLAAALSLFPGVGHLYNEQFGRAALAFFGTVALMVGFAFLGLLINVVVTAVSLFSLSWLGTLLMILTIGFGVVFPLSITAWDAYDQAKNLNAG